METKLRITSPASGIPVGNRYCTTCKKPLSGTVAWLELDQRTDNYHDFGGVPDGNSQGWFPFGLTCARNEIAKSLGRAQS